MYSMHKNRGAALLIFMIFFLIGSTALTITLSRSIYSDFVSYRLLNTAAQSFYVAESGVEDMAYRFVVGKTVGASEVVSFRGATATTTYTYDNTDDRFDKQDGIILWNKHKDVYNCEYELRPKAINVVKGSDIPVGVAVNCFQLEGLFVLQWVNGESCQITQEGQAFYPATSAVGVD